MIRTIKDYVAIGLKGMAMGAADVVPGVSGGTIAFISGIYEELLGSISNVNIIIWLWSIHNRIEKQALYLQSGIM